MSYLIVLVLTLSLIYAPWWAIVFFAGLLATFKNTLPWLLAAGLIMDTWFGAPIATLGGAHYLYTIIFVLFGLAASFIRSRVID